MSNLVNDMYWLWEGALSKEFCRAALEQVDWATAGAGEIYGDNSVVDPKVRRTDIIWQDFMQPLGCIAKAYIDVANQSSGWNYTITGQEATQIGRYKSIDEG